MIALVMDFITMQLCGGGGSCPPLYVEVRARNGRKERYKEMVLVLKCYDYAYRLIEVKAKIRFRMDVPGKIFDRKEEGDRHSSSFRPFHAFEDIFIGSISALVHYDTILLTSNNFSFQSSKTPIY